MGKQKHKGKKLVRSLRRKPQGGYPQEQVERFVLDCHYTFWLAHGANYLASSLESGLWRPIFNIYSGAWKETPERISLEVFTLYQTSEGLVHPGPAILGWCGLKPSKVFGFYQELHDSATTEQCAHLRDPHVEYVWRAFQPLYHVHL